MTAKPMIIATILILLLTSILPQYSMAQSSAGMHVEGPSVVATNTMVKYRVIISGIFDTYKCTLLMAGKNLSGASPTNQVIKVNQNGIFEFDVHTPNATQRIYLDFKAYGIENNTGKIKIFHRRLYVDVKEAYNIIATVKNPQDYEVKNITVNFYIDGKFVGKSTIDKISPNSTAKVSYAWVPNVAEGEHVLKMEVIGKGTVFENGKQVYTKRIYIGNPPNYDWVGYVGIATVIALASILLFIFLGRRRGHEAKPKWKK